MNYCKICLIPNTRPNIFFEKKLCNVCYNKERINWNKRKKEFLFLIKKIRNRHNNYDCVIPVSGGKDSTWQVVMALKYKLKPLCVTWKTPSRSKIGEKNLKNLISLGIDHIDFTINPKVEKLFTLKSFIKFGSPAIPMHMALHNIPKLIATQFNIPLIIWGENSASEYGGVKKLKGKHLSNKWRSQYGNFATNLDLIFDKRLTKKSLFPYISHLNSKKKVKEVFLGYFFKWDPIKTYNFAKKYGFKNLKKPKIGLYNFADIDDNFIVSIHHWMKWYKFGFTRLWDNISLEIRKERLSKKSAIELIANQKIKIDHELGNFCNYLNISKNHFYKIAEQFRNKEVWKKNKKKIWYIDNFLIKNYRWK